MGSLSKPDEDGYRMQHGLSCLMWFGGVGSEETENTQSVQRNEVLTCQHVH